MPCKLTLHSYRRCPFAIRVRMTLEEKQIPYTVIEENLAEFSPELLRLHPEGRVPLLVHHKTGQDLVIYESAIITEYLDEAFENAPKLMPSSAEEKARVRLWTYWSNQIFKADLDKYKYEYQNLDEDQKKQLLSRLNEHFRKLEEPLSKTDFLLGDQLTLADIHIFPLYRQLAKIQPALSELENYLSTQKWFHKLLERKSFVRAMAISPAS